MTSSGGVFRISSTGATGETVRGTVKEEGKRWRAALTQAGYVFHSNSPMEDFLDKLGQVRVEEAGRVPPGQYRMYVYRTLSDRHNDGLGMEAGSFLPAGEFLRANPRLVVR